MDIKCPRCGEPWDFDCLHDAGARLHKSYDFMRELFTRHGCAAIELADNDQIAEAPTCEKSSKSAAYSVIMELSGDDLDGYAADIEDFEALGLL